MHRLLDDLPRPDVSQLAGNTIMIPKRGDVQRVMVPPSKTSTVVPATEHPPPAPIAE